MLGHILDNPTLLPSEKCLCDPLEKWTDLAKFFLAFQVHGLAMHTMNKSTVHADNINETISTSEADEIELVNAISTTIKHTPHLLKLQVPTSIENVTVSFQPRSQGPVTIEISLTTPLPELSLFTNPPHVASSQNHFAVDTAMSMNAIKQKPADIDLHASPSPLRMNAVLPAGPDGIPADDILSASAQLVVPCVPVGDDGETEPESEEGTPKPIEKTASEVPVAGPAVRASYWSLKRSFTPDSFAGDEDFDSVNTQYLRERWAQIREGLIAGQKRRQPIFSEASISTPPS